MIYPKEIIKVGISFTGIKLYYPSTAHFTTTCFIAENFEENNFIIINNNIEFRYTDILKNLKIISKYRFRGYV